MSKIFALISIVFAGLAGADYLSVAPTVSAKDYEYCLLNYSSGMRECGFDTIEQCVVVISGRGGSCGRSPYLAEGPRRRRTEPKLAATS